MSQDPYDFIVVGAGSAGLQLILGFLDSAEFKTARILILDKDQKTVSDKTWCFWEEGKGRYDEIIYRKWDSGSFYSDNLEVKLDMGKYSYKMIRSLDFYNHARKIIANNVNVEWKYEEVESITPDGTVSTKDNIYIGNYVFDSRVEPTFDDDVKSIKLLQHFLGWTVRFEEDTFDPHSFTMMDFRENKEENTSFTYVLPLDSRTALIEFTLFSHELLDHKKYEYYLKNYIEKVLKKDKYEIIDVEKGVIPMSTYPFHHAHQHNLMKIGTAGGWVKPSSGYSFRISQDFIGQLIANLNREKKPWKGVAKGKHRFYDAIVLEVMDEDNAKGKQIFETMYSQLPANLIFKFLDERTTLSEDLRIMSKFTNMTFAKAFFKQLYR